MSGQPQRKIPRIISRTKTRSKTTENVQKAESSASTSAGQDALVKELMKEKVVVKDGCLVAVQHIEKGAVHGIVGATSSHGGRRITIVVPESDSNDEPYVENPLPGVADEVESYPCRFCPDSVFLTHYGLERHAKQNHPEHFDSIMEEIEKIQKEWERREKERNRMKEKAMIAKARHESYAMSALRFAHTGRFSLGEEGESSGPERYDACKICNMLVNVKTPAAMDHHLGAHKKNDQLKISLLETYGEEIVNRLSCHECRLVFTDSTKLNNHIEQSHTRRRKFVCKYCGQICMSMADLNMHKAEIHAIGANNNAARNSHLITMKRHQQQRAETLNQSQNYGKDLSRLYRAGYEELICSTECAECGLKLVRPSLLVRHMLRVHNKPAFCCDITTRGLPGFRIEVAANKIYWWCCEHRYIDRHEFLMHRRNAHLEPLMYPKKNNTNESQMRTFVETSEGTIAIAPGNSYEADLVHEKDNNFHINLPKEVDSDGRIFVVVQATTGEYIQVAKEDLRIQKGRHQEVHQEIHEDINEEMHQELHHEIHENVPQEDVIEEIVEGMHDYQEYYEHYEGDDLDGVLYYVNEGDEIVEGEDIEIQAQQEDLIDVDRHHEDPTCEEMFEPIM